MNVFVGGTETDGKTEGPSWEMDEICDNDGNNHVVLGGQLQFAASQHNELLAYLNNPKGEPEAPLGPTGKGRYTIRTPTFHNVRDKEDATQIMLAKRVTFACLANRKRGVPSSSSSTSSSSSASSSSSSSSSSSKSLYHHHHHHH
jgi:hypothetical protein